MAKKLREITEESEAMEKEIAKVLTKKMNVKPESITGTMIVNMAIKEMYERMKND